MKFAFTQTEPYLISVVKAATWFLQLLITAGCKFHFNHTLQVVKDIGLECTDTLPLLQYWKLLQVTEQIAETVCQSESNKVIM